MPIVSISLTSELLRKLDLFIREKGYSSRSEAIRDAIRDSLSEYELSKFERGKVTATITVISNRGEREIDERLMKLRHEHDEIVSNNMHIHLGKRYCLEIFITEGEAEEILEFIAKIRSMRGVRQVKYTMIPITSEE
ncbi:nickel-responsive transcriptional regulator NikR [Candidatus Bathyarchaeota archaeon]|nr:nickel-responsive transcriptional regulator NikR [Candidatus Bathyarchaeota archaeon]